MQTESEIAELATDLLEVRKYLHAHPELSGHESETASFIREQVAACKPTAIYENVGGTGIIAVFDSGESGPTVIFRAELDALPIEESNDFGHKSVNPGASHKCGHDGHMTILLGLARTISRQPLTSGKVALLFQPSEENGRGATRVLKEEALLQLDPDYIFALHNLPGFHKGAILIREGLFTASVQSLIIELHGETAHAGEPELGKNPAMAMAEILKTADEMSNNDPLSDDFALITPVHAKLGKIAYGISAGYGVLRFTLRSWDRESIEVLSEEFYTTVEDIAAKHDLGLQHRWTNIFRSTRNDPQAVRMIKEAAATHGYEIIEKDRPFKWGEDFGVFTKKYRGAMFGIGAGKSTPALHSAMYDFPDDVIGQGLNMFTAIYKQILG